MDLRKHLRYTLLAPVAFTVALLSPREGRASSSFPEELKNQLAMQCAPPCTICHRTLEGGAGTTDKNFAAAMVTASDAATPGTDGLVAGQPATVALAVAAVEKAGTDSDGDGRGDIAELSAGSDPNVAGDGATDALLCGPTYGCGARVASRPPVDGSALAVALLVAGFLGLRARRRA